MAPFEHDGETDDNIVPLRPGDAPVQEDIDPADWLADDSVATLTKSVVLKTGGKQRSLKIAGLTDDEAYEVERQSRRPDKRDPRRQTREFTLYKRMFIAASINKAYGKNLGDPGYVTPEALGKKPIGELTKLMSEVMEVSGTESESSPAQAETFFS